MIFDINTRGEEQIKKVKKHDLRSMEPFVMQDEQQFLTLVRAGQSAPSGDNCQPFRFRKIQHGIEIHNQPDRSKHFFNCAHTADWLSLGCTIEAMAVAAEKLGLKLSHEIHVEGLDGSEPVAICRLSPLEGKPKVFSAVYDSLLERVTDRRPFSGGSIEETGIMRLPQIYQAQQRVLTGYSKELLNFMKAVEGIPWVHEAAHRDLFKWVRFNPDEVATTQDGMPIDCLGLDILQQKMLRLMKSYKVQTFFNKMGFLAFARGHLAKLIRSSAALVGIAAPGKTPDNLVEAGRLSLFMWLTLNAKGYSVQPISTAALMSFYWKIDALPPSLRPEFMPILANGYHILRKSFDCRDGESIVWLFRTGRKKHQNNGQRAPRLPLNQVIN